MKATSQAYLCLEGVCILHCLHNIELLVAGLAYGKVTLLFVFLIMYGLLQYYCLAEVTRNKHGCMFQMALNSFSVGVRGMECRNS